MSHPTAPTSQRSSHPSEHRLSAGFTVVEVLVTIMVAAMFIIALYLLSTSVNSAAAGDRNRANASDIAYGYLRKYATADLTPLTWSNPLVCDNTSDLTANASASGQILESGTLSSGLNGIPTPVTYKVTALAIYGCSGANSKKPVRVEAQITYGPNSQVIKHTTFVGYV